MHLHAKWRSIAREVKVVKQEKKEAVERMCSEAEDAAKLNDTRKLFNITKQLAPKAAAPMVTVWDNGVPCMDLEHEPGEGVGQAL